MSVDLPHPQPLCEKDGRVCAFQLLLFCYFGTTSSTSLKDISTISTFLTLSTISTKIYQFYHCQSMIRFFRPDRDRVSPVCRTDFVVTASGDGHVKFWRKEETGIEFVKHFRAHLGAVQDMAVNGTGTLLCTISTDKSVKIFDVINFGMVIHGRCITSAGLYRLLTLSRDV